MPLTELQRAQLRPQLDNLCKQRQRMAAPERAQLLRVTLESAGATPSWEEWDAFVREELGSIPATLARPAATA